MDWTAFHVFNSNLWLVSTLRFTEIFSTGWEPASLNSTPMRLNAAILPFGVLWVHPPVLGPVHTGRGAPCNTRAKIMEHTAVNGSVHTGCKATSKGLHTNLHAYTSCVDGALGPWVQNPSPGSKSHQCLNKHPEHFSFKTQTNCPCNFQVSANMISLIWNELETENCIRLHRGASREVFPRLCQILNWSLENETRLSAVASSVARFISNKSLSSQFPEANWIDVWIFQSRLQLAVNFKSRKSFRGS